MFEIEIPQKHAVETETTSSKGNQRIWDYPFLPIQRRHIRFQRKQRTA